MQINVCAARSWASSNPACISEAVRSVCLKRGLSVLERGKCVCLVLDLEKASVCMKVKISLLGNSEELGPCLLH